MTTVGKVLATRFEISIDGVPRSHRDRREIAVEVPAADGQVSAQRRGGEGPAKRGEARGRIQARPRPALMPLTMRPTGLPSSPVDKGPPRLDDLRRRQAAHQQCRGQLTPIWHLPILAPHSRL